MPTGNQVFLGKTDYVMLGLMLAVSMGIGVFFAVSGSKKQTKVEYLLGSRNLGAVPVCLSLFATFQSAISLLGVPAEVYSYGTMTMYSTLGAMTTYVIASLTVVPLFHPLKITSVNEYLEARFKSRTVRLLGALIGLLASISYMTIALLSPALALQTAVDFPLWLSIVLIGAVGTIYTAIGGIKSVIWTDVFQTVIIFGGIIFILIKGSMDVGGINKVFDIASDNGRIIYDDISLDPRVRHTLWGLSFGGAFYWMAVHFTQSSVQRVVSIRSQIKAQIMLVVTIPLVLLYATIMILSGLVLVAYFFAIECDPLKAGYIYNRNQLMPYFVMHSFSFLPGLPGLYMATIFSGALSTLSSGINSLAASTVEDFLGTILANKKETIVTAISKIIVCLYGAGIIGLAYLARGLPGPVTQTTYTALAATSGPLLGIFILGGAFPMANSKGTILGLTIGLMISWWISVGSFLYSIPTPQLPYGSINMCDSRNVTESTSWNSSRSEELYEAFTSAASDLTSVTLATSARGTTTGLSAYRQFSVYDISYVYSPIIGTVATVIPGLIASLITGYFQNKNQWPNPRLLFPFVRRLYKYDAEELNKNSEQQMNFILN